VIEDSNHANHTPAGAGVHHQNGHQYFYPPMPYMMSPNVSPNQAGNTPTPPYPSPMYYMYPPHMAPGYLPHPMHHPMGSPMYMGGMWPPPPYPMMPPINMSPSNHQSGGGGRGNRSNKQKSPRHPPNQQSPSYRSQSSRSYKEKHNTSLPTPPSDIPQQSLLDETSTTTTTDTQTDQSSSLEQKKKFMKKKKDRNSDSVGPSSGDASLPFLLPLTCPHLCWSGQVKNSNKRELRPPMRDERRTPLFINKIIIMANPIPSQVTQEGREEMERIDKDSINQPTHLVLVV
jgi:hypothetical protein